jgi:hypothetical protein
MALVNSGRLSVQPVDEEAWSVIEMMTEKGGWDEMNFAKGKKKGTKAENDSKKPGRVRAPGKGRKKGREDDSDEEVSGSSPENSVTNTSTVGQKRKAVDNVVRRRSTRVRR